MSRVFSPISPQLVKRQAGYSGNLLVGAKGIGLNMLNLICCDISGEVQTAGKALPRDKAVGYSQHEPSCHNGTNPRGKLLTKVLLVRW